MRRRTFLAAPILATMNACIARATPSLAPEQDFPDSVGTLSSCAATKGLFFGTAVKTHSLQTDPIYAALINREASMLVAEYEMKRDVIDANLGQLDFAPAEMLINFARENGQKMRGHTLCWYAANPPRVTQTMRDPAVDLRRKELLLTDYVDKVASHFAGRMMQWDVVNEPIDPAQGRPDGLRAENIWSEALGEQYIDLAFHHARQADPHATLYLTDYGLESDIPWNEAKRTALLKLLDRLFTRNVPIDGLGLQGHLQPFRSSFNERVFRDFLDKIVGYGLKISVTELDFSDRTNFTFANHSDIKIRDNQVAAQAKAFLDVVLSYPQTQGVLCWGLSDRYSWLSTHWAEDRWPDGDYARALPFDANFQKKKLYRAVKAALDAAPSRPMMTCP